MTAPQQLPQFNTAGNMQTVVHGVLNGVVVTAAQILFESGINGFPAGWVAPLPGTLFALSGAQKGTTGTSLQVNVNINGATSGFSSAVLALNGSIQTFSAVATSVYTFNAGDLITMHVVPSGTALVSGVYVSAALAVLM